MKGRLTKHIGETHGATEDASKTYILTKDAGGIVSRQSNAHRIVDSLERVHLLRLSYHIEKRVERASSVRRSEEP